jgi:uncharacterized protein YcbK (DUF882 family)
MIKIKSGVSLKLMTPQMAIAALVVAQVYDAHQINECVITSGSDGKHSKNSLHYKGLALDFRTRDIKTVIYRKLIAQEIRDALGSDFDVVVESDHIHVEFDVK